RSAARDNARSSAPRERLSSSIATRITASTAPAQKIGPGTIGEKSIDQLLITLPTRTASLSQPFQQGGHVHLVGLVVAGERVHDDVDPGSECHLTLALAAGHDRVERLSALVHRPGGREIVRRDQDGAHAVDTTGLAALIAVARHFGFNPQ